MTTRKVLSFARANPVCVRLSPVAAPLYVLPQTHGVTLREPDEPHEPRISALAGRRRRAPRRPPPGRDGAPRRTRTPSRAPAPRVCGAADAAPHADALGVVRVGEA